MITPDMMDIYMERINLLLDTEIWTQNKFDAVEGLPVFITVGYNHFYVSTMDKYYDTHETYIKCDALPDDNYINEVHREMIKIIPDDVYYSNTMYPTFKYFKRSVTISYWVKAGELIGLKERTYLLEDFYDNVG